MMVISAAVSTIPYAGTPWTSTCAQRGLLPSSWTLMVLTSPLSESDDEYRMSIRLNPAFWLSSLAVSSLGLLSTFLAAADLFCGIFCFSSPLLSVLGVLHCLAR